MNSRFLSFIFGSILGEFLLCIVLPFILWLISWKDFISGKLGLGSDAFYYYFDSRFFIENISRGVYPLWNPYYSGGVSWNFFLRRMGELNPFYWTITPLKFLGLSPLQAHLIFLILYYFLGLVGFWLLARLILKDRLCAAAAYLFLVFSWGGQIFYCFDILVFVPLVWFFYFIFSFGLDRKKHQFLGICFTLGLIVTTYIPFFALTIISFFIPLFYLFFRKETHDFFSNTAGFVRANRTFAALTLVFLLFACVPAVDFYLESKHGGFVLPTRHFGATDSSELAIGTSQDHGLTDISISPDVWDILACGYFDKVFSNQSSMNIGDFNIAYLFFIIPVLALINRFSRRSAFLLVYGVLLTVSVMTKSRIYPFLFDHVFFFRFMRMLQLFLWLGTIPVAVLWVSEQLRVFLREQFGRKNVRVLAFVIGVHLFFVAGLLTQQGVFVSSYAAVGMSLLFFVLAVLGRFDKRALAPLLWIGLILQPLEIAWHINRNADIWDSAYITDRNSRFVGDLSLLKGPAPQDIKRQALEENTKSTAYYENPWFYNLRQVIDKDRVSAFVAKQLIFYDNTIPEEGTINEKIIKISSVWELSQNLVYLPWEDSQEEDFRTLGPGTTKPQVVYANSPELKVISSDANTIRVRTNLDRPRFLLWTNGYHPGWHVYIDGREGRLLRADYAFKGAWIPPGVHEVLFRFGTPLRYALAFFLLFAFALALISIVLLGIREGLSFQREVTLED